MNTKDLERKGRYMSLLLRHSPKKENLSMDEYGYVNVKDLCDVLKINQEGLDWIVDNNNKKRFIFGGGHQKNKIKATQGHSFKVKLELEPIKPPPLLFHGTSWDNKEAILNEGLNRMKRQHVHLTNDMQTAMDVGMRYAKNKGKLWLITIESHQMWKDGYKFYKSENNVWLTDIVPSKYFKL